MSELYAELHETHTGIVLLVGDRALKAKKPCRMTFLDFSSVELREKACARELDLNRRLAADVYLGLGHLSDPLGGPSEPIVVMRRMSEKTRLSTAVRSSEIDRQGTVPFVRTRGSWRHRRRAWNVRARSVFAGSRCPGVQVDPGTRTRKLENGVSVIIDASWTDPERVAEAAALALATDAVHIVMHCTAPLPVAAARISQRRGGDSDATVAVASVMAERVTTDLRSLLVVDTSGSVEASVDIAEGGWNSI